MTALFENIIFGPIKSRRLGLSLGINLLPEHAKICNFDCIYCECGDNNIRRGEASQRRFALREQVSSTLREKLSQMVADQTPPDVITFAGNGEPTLHPQFEQIIDDTLSIRDELKLNAKISVLSNATTLNNPSVVRALQRVDNNILKLDSAIDKTAHIINRPTAKYSVEEVIQNMAKFGGNCIVQTMFLRGVVDGEAIDNTTDVEIERWVEAVRYIAPKSVMIYSIDRDTPCQSIQRVDREELEVIAKKLLSFGILCSVA